MLLTIISRSPSLSKSAYAAPFEKLGSFRSDLLPTSLKLKLPSFLYSKFGNIYDGNSSYSLFFISNGTRLLNSFLVLLIFIRESLSDPYFL